MTARPAVQLGAYVTCTVVGALVGNAWLLWQLGSPDSSEAQVREAPQPLPMDWNTSAPRPLTIPVDAAIAEPMPQSAPKPLNQPEHATPLFAESSPLDEVIRHELPGISESELRIWQEELRGLDAETARGILRMRRSLHPTQREPSLPTVVPTTPQFNPPSSSADAPRRRHWASTLAALEQAERVVLNNLANADVPGFKRLGLVWEDRPYDTADAVSLGTGTRLAATSLDATPARLRHTGQAWHWAIDGIGFYQVRDGAVLHYTRSGRFAVHQGQVVVVAGDHRYPLEPRVPVPDHVAAIDVSADGTLTAAETGSVSAEPLGQILLARFPRPDALRPQGATLLAASEHTGPVELVPPGTEGCGEIRQGSLEESNIDWDAEYDRLIRLQARMEALRSLASLLPAEAPGRIAIRPEGQRGASHEQPAEAQ